MEENVMGNEYFTLTDEDGNELEFELIGQCEMNGVTRSEEHTSELQSQ